MKDLKQALERVIQRIVIPSHPEVLSFEVIPSIFSNILHINIKIPRGYRDKVRLMKLNSELKSLARMVSDNLDNISIHYSDL